MVGVSHEGQGSPRTERLLALPFLCGLYDGRRSPAAGLGGQPARRAQLGQSPGILLPPLMVLQLVHQNLQEPNMSVGRVGGDSKHFGAWEVWVGIAGLPGLTVRP